MAETFDPFADLGHEPRQPSKRSEPRIKFQPLDPFADLGLEAQPTTDAKPTGDLAGVALGAGLINGVPIVGPALLSGVQKAAALAESTIGGTKYDDELKRVKERTAVAERDNPKLSTAGNLGGAVAGYTAGSIPALGARFLGTAGPTILSRIGFGTVGNALVGGADSAARGENPLTGAVFGGMGGAAGPVIGKAAGSAIGATADAIGSILPTNIPGVSRPAAQTLNKLILADDPAAIQASLARTGELGMLADAGPSLKGVAGSLAAMPGEAQGIIRGALEGRQAGAINRLTGDINGALGPAPLPSRVEAGLAAGRDALGPEYGQAFARARAVDTMPLANALDASVANLRGPAQQAVQRVRSYLNVPGTDVLDPNPQALLATRQAIDGLIAGEQNPQVVRQLTMARQQVDGELGRAVPGIKQVDAKFAELSRQSEALQSGGRILDSGKTAIRPEDLATDFAQSANPQGAMVGPSAAPIRTQQGARAEIDRLVGTKSNDLAALRSMLQGEGGWNTAKLSTVFGEEPTNRLLNSVQREATFADTANRITQNSETARRKAGEKFLEAAEPGAINLSGSTMTGLGLQAAKKWLLDPTINMIMRTSSAPMQAEMARVLTMQGMDRDKIIRSLLSMKRMQSTVAGGGAMLSNIADASANRLISSSAVTSQR